MICKATTGTTVNSSRPTTDYYAKSKSLFYVGGTYSAFVQMAVPARKANRRIISAFLEYRMQSGTGSARTTTVQRMAKPAKALNKIRYATRPGVYAGSVAVNTSQVPTTILRRTDVTADLRAYMAGAPFYGFRITSSHGSAWAMSGWASKSAPQLVIEYADEPAIPTGVSPNGVIAVAAPTVTWAAPAGIVSARIQVANTTDPTFFTPIYDSGDRATTIGQLSLATLGWAGLALDASALVRVLYTNEAGYSAWSLPVTITRKALTAPAITGPSGSTTDPTPVVQWTSSGQTRFQVLTYVDGKLVDDSGVQPGTDTAWMVGKGATTPGSIITIKVRTWDSLPRAVSPGDPGYGEATVSVTYTPGTAPAVTTFTVTGAPDGAPWMDLSWARVISGSPAPADEYLIIRNNVVIDRIDGISPEGAAVYSYRDVTAPPNTDLTYYIRPVINGAAGTISVARTARSTVTGAWVFDPLGTDWFVVTGDSIALAFGESASIYEPIGGPALVKRTFAMRGLEGSISGHLDDQRTGGLAAALTAFFRIKSNSDQDMRVAFGDTNIPCSVAGLTTTIDPDRSLTDQIVRTCSLEVRQTGELPFDPITPVTASA